MPEGARLGHAAGASLAAHAPLLLHRARGQLRRVPGLPCPERPSGTAATTTQGRGGSPKINRRRGRGGRGRACTARCSRALKKGPRAAWVARWVRTERRRARRRDARAAEMGGGDASVWLCFRLGEVRGCSRGA